MKFLILLIFVISSIGELDSNINENLDSSNKRCRLEENLEDWNLREDYQLLNSFISRDTLEYEFNPRDGMYINAIARIEINRLNNATSVVIDTVLLYGDSFERKDFENYFIQQYKAYIYSLVEKYPLKESYSDNECLYLIHQKKIRSCG